jgi:hypothetical protein
MASLGGVTFRIARGSYSGFAYEDTAKVIPLLGGDPLLPSNNEVIQSNALGSRVARLDAVVTSAADRDTLESMLFSQAVFDAGDGDGEHPVTVMAAPVRIPIFVGTVPEAWLVSLELREYASESS